MSTGNTKRNIKNAAKTGGKFALKGVKLAGKGVLTVAELAGKGTASLIESRTTRKILAGAGTLAANVMFAQASITITALNYLVQNCVLGKNYSAASAIKATFGTTNKVLEEVLGIASVPTAALARGAGKLAKEGKKALDGR